MCRMLMPIKPEYVEEILSGRKKYEYRKIKARNKNVDIMLIYSTSPVMKVVGEVEILDIIESTPNEIWSITSNYSGISKKIYDRYFREKETAVAYKIGKIKKYDNPLALSDIGINYFPQSFVYLD